MIVPGGEGGKVKRLLVLLLLLAMTAALVLSTGCGASENGAAGDNGDADGEASTTQFNRGFSDGHTQGYERGYADGKKGIYEPGTLEDSDEDDDYARGFDQGWIAGYEEGQKDASEEAADAEKEMEEVEKAMLAFVKENAAPGLEFRIENIVIHGDEAAGIAVCTSEVLESPLVVMRKDASGWTAVDFGTGIEPPAWYPY